MAKKDKVTKEKVEEETPVDPTVDQIAIYEEKIRNVKFCADADGNYLGRHVGDLPEGCVVADSEPSDARMKWNGSAWVLPDESHNDDMNAARRAAYVAEADPLAFKMLRKEIEEKVYLDKIKEIKERYPKR